MPDRTDATRGREDWGQPMVAFLCEACDWRYLAPAGSEVTACPHCAAPAVVALDLDAAQFPYAYPPELIVPFSVPESTIDGRIEAFADGIPYPPADLVPAALKGRLQRIYLPMWLVDSDVEARWRAEVGFDYEVVSHQERYADGAGWQTNEVHEGRVRWEPRLGRLIRHYDNVPAPALTRHAQLSRALGHHEVRGSEPYRAVLLDGALVRAPDMAPEAAWPEAELALRQWVADECRRAAAADHIRDFRWTPEYRDRNWTLLLLPIYTTLYHDDDGVAQRVLINGQTGQLTGMKRGSMARAGRVSLTIGIVAFVVFAISLIVALLSSLFPPLLIVGLVGAFIALAIGVGAVVPVARVWAFNRQQSQAPPEV